VVKASDLFDDVTLMQSIAMLIDVLKKVNRPLPLLATFAERLAEGSSLYFEDLTTLSLVFQFFTLSKLPITHLGRIVNAAKCIIAISIEAIYGKPRRWPATLQDMPFFKEVVAEDLVSRNVDVLTSQVKITWIFESDVTGP